MTVGVLMFDKEKQDTHSGGSGCACLGTIFSGYFFKQLKDKKIKIILVAVVVIAAPKTPSNWIKKILLIATGALMNSTSTQQGESIPGIAHAISIEV